MKMTKSSLIRPALRGLVLALAVTALSSFVARAVPYASGIVSNDATHQVSFILNQDAQSVVVLRDGGNAVSPGTTKGQHSFDMTGYTTFQIIVSNNVAQGWTQFSSDSLTQSKYYSPRGVCVDTNPKRSTFGQIIVAEGLGGAVGAGGRTTTDGLYIMSADQGDILSQGDTAFAGGVDWSLSSSSPYHVSMNQVDPTGEDYTIYIGDYYDGHSGVWTASLTNPSAAFNELFDDTTRDATGVVTNSFGQAVHGNIPGGPWVEGVGPSRVMYTVDEDVDRSDVHEYDIGTTTSGYDTAPILRTTGVGTYLPFGMNDVVRDTDGSWWICDYRYTDGSFGNSVTHWPDNGFGPLWLSGPTTVPVDGAQGGIDINQYENLLVCNTRFARIVVIDIFDRDNPKLNANISHSGSYIRDVAFDAAGNIYAVSSSSETLRIYSRGGSTVTTTSSDGTFDLYRPSELTVAATDPDAAEPGTDTGTFNITKRFGPSSASVQVYFTMSGTAVSNVDYTISPTSPATIPAGQTNVVITVTPIDNGTPEAPETVVLTLAAGDYDIGSPSSATVVITDNDAVYRYWDSNGATAGAGFTPTGTWGTDNFWSTAADGTLATAGWTDNATAVFSAGGDAWDTFTVTVNGTQNVGSLSFEEGTPTLDGGTLNYQNVLPIPVLGGNTLIRSVIAGTAGLSLDGPSSLGLAAANTYSGPTVINGGNLIVAADGGVIPDGSAVILGATGKLFLEDQLFQPVTGHSETIGSLAGEAGAEVNVPAANTLTFGGDNTDTTWGGSLSGGGSLVKVGSGKTSLGTSGTMANTLTISGGTISFDSTAQLASVNPITNNNGGVLESTSVGVGTGFLPGRPITMGSGGGTLRVATGSAILMMTDAITGPGTLTTDGPGELRTYDVEHSFAKLIVKAGLYTAGHAVSRAYNTSFGAIPASTTADAITIYGGAAIRKAGGWNVALDPKQGVFLTGAGTKTIRAYAGDANSGTFEITGTISGTGPLELPGPFDYAYAPIMVLEGQNTYSDGTIVQRGNVYVINSFTGSGTGSGTVTVNNAAVLGGQGNLGGPVVVTGGSLSPGYSYYTGQTPGTNVAMAVAKLALTNGLDLSASGTYAWQLGALSTANPGTDWDQVDLVGGNLTLGGSSVLDIGFTGSATAPDLGQPFWQTAQQWKVVANSGAGSVSGNISAVSGTNGITAGTFTTVADGTGVTLVYTPNVIPPAPVTMSAVSVSGGNITIDYSGGTGSQFVLLKSLNVDALLNTWTPMATNATPAGSFVIPVGSDPKVFYCIQSQ